MRIRDYPDPLPDRTEEEIAAEEVGGDVLVLIEAAAWRSIAVMPGLPAFLLDTAERGGRPAVLAILARHGIGTGPHRRAPPVAAANVCLGTDSHALMSALSGGGRTG